MSKQLFFIFFFVCSYAQAQIVDIPDANFKSALVNSNIGDIGNGIYENIDTNNDGEIQVTEAEAVIRLRAQILSISSLDGIESFINLEELRCGTNDLTTIDVSALTMLRYLSVDVNDITGIDISNNVNLETFVCSQNLISSLDISQNTALTYLDCNVNQLSSIDLSSNINLEVLALPGNELLDIDLSSNVNLREFNCQNNLISSLDLEQNILLERLNIARNNISSIDLSNNINLLTLSCLDNNISNLDVSMHPNIFSLICYDNKLESLNIQNGNNLTLNFMNTTGNPSLKCIQIDDEFYANAQTCNISQGQGWCKDTAASYSEDCQLGSMDQSSESFEFYPNPVSDFLSIVSSRNPQPKLAEIYDAQGRLISEEKMNSDQLDVSNLQAGIYFLKIRSGFDVQIISFVKE